MERASYGRTALSKHGHLVPILRRRGDMIESSRVARALAIGAMLFQIQVNTVEAFQYLFTAHARSGQPSRIWNFYDCTTHSPVSEVAGAFVEHGSVSFKDTVGNRCGVPSSISERRSIPRPWS